MGQLPAANGSDANVLVRPARADEACLIRDFQVAMAVESEGLELDPGTVGLGVAAVFDHPERGRYLVAEVAGEVAGSLLLIPEWSDWRNGTVLWIHSVYVVPAMRRRGVFRAVYRHLKNMVEQDRALRGLRLFVERDNAVAQRVYAELGMDDQHYRMFEWLKD